MEKRNLEIFNQVSQGLAEGVDRNKAFALAGLMSETSIDVEKVFQEHGYDLSNFPLKFLKMYAVNEKELGELIEVLKEYTALGLKETANASLEPATFKLAFLGRVKFCIDNNINYRDEEGKFASWLFNAEAFGRETAGTVKIEDVKTVSELMAEGKEVVVKEEAKDRLAYLDDESRQIYQAINYALSSLNFSTPGDDTLNRVVSNLLDLRSENAKNLINALVRKEYTFGKSISEIITDYAFNGLEIPGSEQARVASMITEAMEMEEEKVVGGR